MISKSTSVGPAYLPMFACTAFTNPLAGDRKLILPLIVSALRLAGNTGYLELVFLIRQVNELKRSQLDELERYNNAVLQYEFLFQ